MCERVQRYHTKERKEDANVTKSGISKMQSLRRFLEGATCFLSGPSETPFEAQRESPFLFICSEFKLSLRNTQTFKFLFNESIC